VRKVLRISHTGELFATYHKYRWHGSSTKARFYSASVTLAFEHLHERFVIYRDLKPENLLLTATGHCKLTDMGLAKQTSIKTYTTCGTPDYFAPEVINQVKKYKVIVSGSVMQALCARLSLDFTLIIIYKEITLILTSKNDIPN
jgi:serine/threonine protein kinase